MPNEYYERNRDLEILRAKQHRSEIKRKILEYKQSRGCEYCKEDHPSTLDFHHEGDKEFCISDGVRNGYSWARIEKEIKKCKVICRNCHAKLHWSNPIQDFSEEIDNHKKNKPPKKKVSYWSGKTLSEETKKKMSLAKKGKKFTKDHREALSKSHKKNVEQN